MAAMKKARTKAIVAVDLDEVLGEFLTSLLTYYNEKKGTQYAYKDFHSYRFCDVWGGTNEEATDLIYEFFETDYFKTSSDSAGPKGVPPVSGALDALKELSDTFDFYVVTSRQLVIIEETRKWLDTHYPGIFKGALFGNHWAKEHVASTSVSNPMLGGEEHAKEGSVAADAPVKKSKAEMCREINAIALIDDAPGYIDDCLAKAGDQFKLGIIFGNYGWNFEKEPKSDQRRKRCADWSQVKEKLRQLHA